MLSRNQTRKIRASGTVCNGFSNTLSRAGQRTHRIPRRQLLGLSLQQRNMVRGQISLVHGHFIEILIEPAVGHHHEALVAALISPAVLDAPLAWPVVLIKIDA